MTDLSVLIPAHNEAAWLPDCLGALLASDPVAGRVEVVVMANGCTDDTADVARSFRDRFAARDWALQVLDLKQGGKLNALNKGEAAATGSGLVYLDADVTVSPPLLAQLAKALDSSDPRYASGRPQVTVAGNWVTRHYTRFWHSTPFMTRGVPGFGLFAMNRAGRGRWGDWPDIISDDTFARLHFAPEERVAVTASYNWPMIEGFAPLVQVRRRQDVGVAEIEASYPALLQNGDDWGGGPPLWRRALRDPLGFAVFAAVRGVTLMPVLRSGDRWARGR
ncbi:MAG: glycosyltransferase family 2 protein [Sulfitobacter sp.]|nr:glycosyltransferase family 2 protein [Sulfitobacter sp.]